MRDVAHQAAGAHALGLAAWNYNMLHRFAENITAERGWCSLWEIDKFNRPCPADYRDDSYFWYNFPGNFDILACCFRQYLWTADPRYLNDPAFRFFYAKSVNEYVHHWDLDRDGLMEHYPHYGFRGIATYNEEVDDPKMGLDLLAAQSAAYTVYAHMLALENRPQDAAGYLAKAAALKSHILEDWWDAENRRFFGFLSQAGETLPDPGGLGNLFALYFDLLDSPEQAGWVLDHLIVLEPRLNVESRSYFPEVLFHRGRSQAAVRVLGALFDPALPRREYPELSYALIGALCSGLMGVQADARERTVHTLPGLPSEAGWAEMGCIPVFEGQVTVRHAGQSQTILTAGAGRPFFWRAAFPGRFDALEVDGKRFPAEQQTTPAGVESSALIRVASGETHTARVR